jgi:RNA polymerase sigma-70 factor (ECF subfamily)
MTWPQTAGLGAGRAPARPFAVSAPSAVTPAPVAEPEDAALMARYRSGDDDAFRVLYYRYHARLHSFLARLLAGHPSEAEEVFQETWLAVIHGRERYVESARFVSYLFGIAHRRVSDHWRRRYRPAGRAHVDLAVLVDGEDAATAALRGGRDQPHGSAELDELGRDLVRALERLPELQREVFLMRAEGDLSLEEIASITGSTRETVKSRLRYALDKLRPALEEWR